LTFWIRCICSGKGEEALASGQHRNEFNEIIIYFQEVVAWEAPTTPMAFLSDKYIPNNEGVLGMMTQELSRIFCQKNEGHS